MHTMDNLQATVDNLRARIGQRVEQVGARIDSIEQRIRELKREKLGRCRKHLPEGTGPYSVGCVDIMSDHTVQGTFVRLYYPIKRRDIYKCQMLWPPWLPRKQYGKGYVYFKRKNLKLFGNFFNWLGGDMYVPAVWHAPILRQGSKYPVVIFSHGLGGNRTSNTTVCCEWASHGYVVAAIEHRDGSASMTLTFREFFNNNDNNKQTDNSRDENAQLESNINRNERLHRDHSFTEKWLLYERQENEIDYEIRNKQVHVRAQECIRALNLLESMHTGTEDVHNVLSDRFDINQFRGCLDLSRIAVAGHSFGGSTTIATLSKDKRFRTGIILDGWMLPLEKELYKKVEQPLLFVNMETFQWKENVEDMVRLMDTVASDCNMITIRGTCHQSVTDFQFIVNAALGKFYEVRNKLDPYIAIEMTNGASLSFLSKHLHFEYENYAEDILGGTHELIIPGSNLSLFTG